jgi:hypothetical protein
VLVVLAHAADVSARWAEGRLRARSRDQVEFVPVEALGAATTWRHELGADDPRTDITLADGRDVRTGRVTAVLNRMLQPPLAPVAAAVPGDASYVRSELTAFAASWLRALAPRVVNQPTPQGLCGAWRAPVQWRALALEAGLPVAPATFDSRNPPPIGIGFGFDTEPSTTLLAIGGEVFGGALPKTLRAAAHRFTILAETPILGLRFAGREPHRYGWRLLDATPYPDLSNGGDAAITALEALLVP